MTMATSMLTAPVASRPSSSGLWAASRPRKFVSKSPLITYGRQNRPLSLTANQFVRKGTFDLPSDDHEAYQRRSAPHEVSEGPDNQDSDPSSVLSGAAEGDELLDAALHSQQVRLPTTLQNLEVASASGHARAQTSQRKPKKPRASSGSNHRTVGDVTAAKRDQNQLSSGLVKKSERPRRLPEMDELICAAERPDDNVTADPASTMPGIEVQDPITEVAQPQRSSISTNGRQASAKVTKTPLEILRKRFRSTSLSHKCSTWVKRRRAALDKSQLWHCNSKPTIGDGFDALELEIARETKVPKPQPRRKGRRVKPTVAPLQLMGGPLPHVAFNCPPDGLGLDHGAQQSMHAPYVNGSALIQRLKRRDSFSDGELIRAKFAAIKAPARPASDDEDEETDEGFDEENDEDAIVEGFGAATTHEAADESADELSMQSTPLRPVRKSSFVQPKHFSLGSVDCVEAVECDDKSGSGAVHHDHHTSANGNRLRSQLMQVQDAILDDFEQMNAMPVTTGAEMLDKPSGPSHPPASSAIRDPRLRSILKLSDPSMPAVTPAEDTKLNTQCNSRRATNNLVEITGDEGRYFSAAAGLLNADGEPRVIRRQKSSSRYFQPPPLARDIDIPDSLLAVPETSSVPANAILSDESQLATLRESPAKVRPRTAATKDSKSLTRAVSKGAGTLSQSVRRQRSSGKGFVSPVKPARRKIEQC